MTSRLTIAVAIVTLVACAGCFPQVPQQTRRARSPIVVLVSANAEWKVVKVAYPDVRLEHSPWGEFFDTPVGNGPAKESVVFVHGGWGKVAAAGSTQYLIDRWHPAVVVNLGTCGGFAGEIAQYAIVLADRTIIYDIKEAMGDSVEAIRDYSTTIDLAWLKAPSPSLVQKSLLVSGDRDLVPSELDELRTRYHARAGDWESGAIAYTCARNHQRVLILRGVSDLVRKTGGEAYGNMSAFEEGTKVVMNRLLADLPAWLAAIRQSIG